MSSLAEKSVAPGTGKAANRKLKIQKLHEEKHATAIQAQWRGKMIRQQLVENEISSDVDEDELEASTAAPEVAKDMNVEQIREEAAIRTDTEFLKSKNQEEVSSWPKVLVENFESPLEGSAWPELSGHSSLCWKWLMENKKIVTRCVTWNLCGNNPPSKEEIQKLVLPLNKFHMLVVGSEECERSIQASMINPSKKQWEQLLLEVTGEKYAPIRSHTLQAIHLMVFVHVSLVPFVSDVASAAVTTGIANTLGNKGGVGVRLRVGSTSLLFANAHLAAHQNAVKARNANFQRIDTEMPLMLTAATTVTSSIDSAAHAKEAKGAPETEESATTTTASPVATPIHSKATTAEPEAPLSEEVHVAVAAPDEAKSSAVEPAAEESKAADAALVGQGLARAGDAVVFMGDLNYRIRGNRKIVDQLLAQGMHEVLFNNDQLRWSMERRMVLNGFVEPPLHFKPTYKFDVKSDIYDTGLKRRIPAWTDRILYAEKPSVRCVAYDADFSLKTSDHRPVYATFVLDVDFSAEQHTLLEALMREPVAEGESAVSSSSEAKVDYNSKIEFSSQSQVCTIS